MSTGALYTMRGLSNRTNKHGLIISRLPKRDEQMRHLHTPSAGLKLLFFRFEKSNIASSTKDKQVVKL